MTCDLAKKNRIRAAFTFRFRSSPSTRRGQRAAPTAAACGCSSNSLFGSRAGVLGRGRCKVVAASERREAVTGMPPAALVGLTAQPQLPLARSLRGIGLSG